MPQHPNGNNKRRKNVTIVDITSHGVVAMVAELLEKYKIDINEINAYGKTAALVAAERNDVEMLKFLGENGADFSVEDSMGRTPLSWVKKHKSKEASDYIELKLKEQEDQLNCKSKPTKTNPKLFIESKKRVLRSIESNDNNQNTKKIKNIHEPSLA